jgi:hypothetical protein
VGDNIETPYPYVNHLNFSQYIKSLERYLELEWEILVSGHDPVMHDDALILSNLEYLTAFSKWELDLEEMQTQEQHIHLHNLQNLVQDLLERGATGEIMEHYRKAIEVAQAVPEFSQFIPSLMRLVKS